MKYLHWALPLVALGLAGCNLWPADTNPYTTIHPSTDFGQHTQDVYETVTWWVVGISIGVAALMIYVLVRFRDDGSPGNPKQIHGNPQLEFAWTLLPVLIVIAITVPTIRTIFIQGDAAPEGSLEIRVVGKRWWWAFEYLENGVVTANELHIPAGRPVSLLLESDTVIHSFWVPRLGGKRDAVPGRVNRIWFTVTDTPTAGQPIEYLGECAEYCGEQHARMRKRVYAHTAEDYAAWVEKMKTPVKLADAQLQQKGEELFGTAGCAGCHTMVGNKTANGKTGPSLTRYGDRHSIGAGAVTFDGKSEEEKLELLKQWLRDPDSLKSGTTMKGNASRALDGMNIPRELSEDEVDVLARYLLAQK